MRLFRPWFLFRTLCPEAIFRIKTGEKILYMTFDDGPDPVSTPILLKTLEEYGVKAIFFCSGEAAEKYPELIDAIKSGGHILGNHGYKHVDGWKTSTRKYCDDIKAAAKFTSDIYFRPPFGHLTVKQYWRLRKKYKIVFWDIMPYDFDPGFGAKKSFGVLVKKLRPGSIIVLHNSQGSSSHHFLGDFIETAIKRNFRFEVTI